MIANSTQKLGVAVIGLGIGEQHARTYLKLQNCQLQWLYDLDAAKTQAAIATLGQGKAADSLDSILSNPDVNIVSLASYDDAHFQQTITTLQSGKHVFVEKPLCRSIEELRQIKQTWLQQKHLKLESNLVLRAAPLYKWLRNQIQTGKLGQIYAIDGDYLYGRLHKITEGWRKNVENYSVLQGGGVHLVDLMLWLTGEKPITVSTTGNRICTTNTDFRYNDYACATFQFGSGLIGRITANFGCVHRHQHVLRVFGTEGTFIYDDAGPRLHVTRDPAVLAAPLNLAPLPSSKGDLIPPFIQSILNNQDTHNTIQHNFDLISVCAAAEESLLHRSPIIIKYV